MPNAPKKKVTYTTRTPLKEGLKKLGKVLKGPVKIGNDKGITKRK
jgi:hypothetical protein